MKDLDTKKHGISTGITSDITIMVNDARVMMSGPYHFDEDEKKQSPIDFDSLSLDYDYRFQIEKTTYLVHPADILYLTDLVQKLQKGVSADYHIRLISNKGIVRSLHGFGKAEVSTTPARIPSVSAAKNPEVESTALQNENKEHKHHRYLLQKCLDGMPHLVWLSDSQGNFLLFNDRFQSYTGLSIEASEGYKYIKCGLIHPSQIREVTAKWNYALRYSVPYSNETLLKNAEGHYSWHLDSIFPLFDREGKVEFWVGTLIDVNSEFEAEKRIQDNNHLLEAIFNSSLNGIMVLEGVRDENTNKITDLEWKYFNKVAHDIFSQEDLSGKRLSVVSPEGLRNGLLEPFRKVILTGEPVQFEHHFKSAGRQKWFEVSAVKLEDGVVCTFHDISLRKQAELEASDTRHFIQHIANSTPDIIYVIDLHEGKIIYINGKVKDYLGLETEDVYNLGPGVFQKLMHPDDSQRRMEQIRGLSTLEENETREIEVRLKSAQGNWRWFKIRDTVFKRHRDGTVWQTIGLVEDIHDLKSAQDSIMLQHQVDRQAEKIGLIGNWQWNLTTGEVIWGENLYSLLGLEPGGVQPSIKTFIEALHPDDREYFMRETQQIRQLSPGPLKLFYFRVLLSDGSVRNLRAASELLRVHGEDRLIGTVRDVTREVITERELRERISFIETLVESSINRIAVVDRNLRYLIWNKKCEEVYGLKKDEVLGRTVREVYPRIDENPVWLERLQRSLEGEYQHFPEEKSFRTDNYYEGFYVPLINDSGDIYAVLNILHDITERVKSQKELRMLNESLKQKNFELRMMNEQLSTFAFVASHDLREPLRKIQVFTNSILDHEENKFSPRGKEYFQKILSSIGRMNLLIDDILNFSRVHANAAVADPVDLNEVFQNVISDLSEVIREKGVQIRYNALPVYPGNRSQLQQLMQNLISNAIKFQSGKVTPEINVSGRIISGSEIDHPAIKRNQRYLRFEVQDNGIGIEGQYYSKIFQMFQRLHGVSQYSGTGMGLAICKKVVENHDGCITVDSTPGKGSTFTCYLRC